MLSATTTVCVKFQEFEHCAAKIANVIMTAGLKGALAVLTLCLLAYRLCRGHSYPDSLAVQGRGCVSYSEAAAVHSLPKKRSRARPNSELLTPKMDLRRGLSLGLWLLCAGDVEVNPGPIYRYPCGVCAKPVTVRQHGIECTECKRWTHAECCGVTPMEYERMSECEDEPWHCPCCLMSQLPFLEASFNSAHEQADESLGEALNGSVSDELEVHERATNYITYRRDRRGNRRGGGVVVYVAQFMRSWRRPDLEVSDSEALWI